jgi:hypothetical protein
MIWIVMLHHLSGCHWGTSHESDGGSGSSVPTSETADTVEMQLVPANLIERSQVHCAEPEAWKSKGRLYEGDLGEDWLVQPDGAHNAPEKMNSPGYGVAVSDFNGDGRLDIFLPNIAPNQLFLQGEDFVFDEVAEKAGIQAPEDPSDGAVAVDIDGDSDQDIVVFNRGIENKLYLNDGHANFTQVDAFTHRNESISGAFGDYDGDGDLDLVVGNRDEQTPLDLVPDDNVLLENLGGLVFGDVSDILPVAKESEYTYVVSWLNIADDTRPELFIFNDGGGNAQSNRLLKYDGQVFEDISESYQFSIHMDAMGASFGDINQDQKPDIVVSNLGGELLLESVDDGSWIETDAVRGLLHNNSDLNFPYVTWGIEFADIDHDRDLDVVMTAGARLKQVDKSEPWNQPDAIFINKNGSYESRGDEWGFDNDNNNRGLAVVDLNEDGFLDFIVRSVDNHTRVVMQRCTEKNWIKVSLQQSGVNRDAIGAKVVLRQAGGPQERYVMAGGTSLSASLPAQVHFGLDGVETVYKLQVQWPDGAWSTFLDVAVNQHVTVVRNDAVTQPPE